MKKISKNIAAILLTILFLVATSSLYAQQPGSGDHSGGGGVPADPSLPSGSTPTNGAVGHPIGATLANGMYLLFLFGGVYGGYKLYEIRKKKEEEGKKGLTESE